MKKEFEEILSYNSKLSVLNWGTIKYRSGTSTILYRKIRPVNLEKMY